MAATQGQEIERILVAGATGKTGRDVLRHLAEAEADADVDLTVRGLTRSPDSEQTLRERGADEVVVGDLMDPGDARRAVDGIDAVLSCVGSTPLQVHLADRHVDGAGNVNLVNAAVEAGISGAALDAGETAPPARYARTAPS